MNNACQIVNMIIVDKPYSCIFSKTKHFAKFKYNGKIYSKRIGVSFCNKYRIGESVEMKYLKNYNEIMYPDEKTIYEFISMVSLSVFGLFMIFIGIKKNKSKKKTGIRTP